MKLKYFQGKLVYFKEKYEVIWGPCPAVSLKSFRVSKRLDGFVLCIQGLQETSSSKF